MADASSTPVSNHLLASLPQRDRKAVMACAERVDIQFGQVLCQPGVPYRHLYFPLTGFVSLVTPLSGHRPLEVGLIGNEGMLGATLVLGVADVPLRGLVQGSGTALRLTVQQFGTLIDDSAPLRRLLDRYVYVLMAQLAQTAACTRFHDVGHRLARWLLMTHDRAHADHFTMTHQFLADMLGVRRSGITMAAGLLQDDGVIRYTRGQIQVLDRSRLEFASCECYADVVADYAKVMPGRIRSGNAG